MKVSAPLSTAFHWTAIWIENSLLKSHPRHFHRSFKKDMAGWFARFFETLQPTAGELLSLQEEIMQTFTSSYTKPVNIMLQQLKSIASKKDSVIRNSSNGQPSFSSPVPKTRCLTIYSIFEKIVAQHSEMKEPCCITLCQLFLKKDESLQKKAANFISKYGDASSSNLQETLQSYQPEMFQSVHAILASFKPQPIEQSKNPP